MQSPPREGATETALVLGCGVAVQETDRHRLRPVARHGGHSTSDRARSEGNLGPPVREYALPDPMTASARDEGRGQKGFEGIELRTHLAADLEDVLEPFGGEENDTRAAPLEKCVGRHGRAVVEPWAPGSPDERSETRPHGGCGIARRRGDLQDAELAAHERNQVGEGAAGIDADEDG